MGLGTGATAAIVGGIGAAGSIAGAAIGSSGAQNAASTQEQGAIESALLQQGDANAALNFNEQQLNLAEQNTATTRAAGQNATIALNDLMGLSPIAGQPINTGGNVAPQAGGISGAATPGSLATPAAPGPAYRGAPMPLQAVMQQPPAATPAPTTTAAGGGLPNLPGRDPRLYPLAKGGPTKIGVHYLVGEKGPEELVMHPDGTGHVIPHVVSPRSELIHRAQGGPVGPYNGPPMPGSTGNPMPVGGPVMDPYAGNPWTNTGSIIAPLQQGPTGPWAGPPLGGGASTGGRPANPPSPTFQSPSPYGAQGNNPLVTGGSPTPVENTPFTQWTQQFVPPTLAQAENYPGYQFQLEQGEQAINNQASATGELLDPNTQRSLINYAQNAATQDYGNVYNQALQQYDQAYNIFNNNQTNEFNRLSSIAGNGQTSTNALNAGGFQSAGNTGNILLGSAGQIGQNINNAAAATASGYIGSANAYGGAVGNIGNNLSQYLTLQQIMNQQNGGSTSSNPFTSSPLLAQS